MILQLSTYVALLDLGLQTVTSKLLAEYYAKGEQESTHKLLSSSVSLLMLLCPVGFVVVGVLTWRVPDFFHQMPPALIPQVRLSLFMIGAAAAFALPFSAFAAVFTGLQEYGFPTAVALIGRGLSTALLITMVLTGKGLVPMAIVVTIVNVAIAVTQWAGWRRFARERFRFSAFQMDRFMTRRLVRSGGVFAIWTLGFLVVSGLDVVVVGHYDYKDTGFYSIGATATNFMLMCVSSLVSPLLPAVSAMQVNSKSIAVGNVVIHFSRFCALLLCALAIPLTVGAYPLLSLWVGTAYAAKSASFLRILVLGGVVRTLGYPYETIVLATGQQHLATVAVVAESVINLAVSIWLVQHVGAVGVAYGTLIGAVVHVGLHVGVSMRMTQQTITLSRVRFLVDSLLRPLVCVTPVLLLLPFVTWNKTLPASIPLLSTCALATALMMAFVGLTPSDRKVIRERVLSWRKPNLAGASSN
ncbi:MAG: lipopolysaccharide biosynthesis protein [Janthinobacterium lividum]